MNKTTDLNSWVEPEVWRANHASTFFKTPASWSWFRRQHLRELVEAGALIPSSGRASGLVHLERITAAVETIRRRESLKKVGASA